MPTGKMYSNTKPEHFACEINHMIQSQCLGIKPDTDVRLTRFEFDILHFFLTNCIQFIFTLFLQV